MPQPVQNTYKSFEDFLPRIKSHALTKKCKFKVKEQLVVVSLMSSDYVLPVYEMFVDNLSDFTVRVNSWGVPNNHELIQSYDISFINVTLSKFIERLSSYRLCSGITLLGTRNEINFNKHILPKVFDHFDCITADLKQLVFQDEYFRTGNCTLLLLLLENTCKICDKENIKFKTKVNSTKAFLAKTAHLNASVKLTSERKITQDNPFSLKCSSFIPNLIARNNVSNSKSLEIISHQF